MILGKRTILCCLLVLALLNIVFRYPIIVSHELGADALSHREYRTGRARRLDPASVLLFRALCTVLPQRSAFHLRERQ